MFIAEIGINHNGNLNMALKLIKQAKKVGADVVKFQKRNPEQCIPEEQKNLKKIFQGKEMTYLEYKKKLEFEKKEYDIINNYCKRIGIKWTVSVWDIDSVNFIKQYKEDIPFIKIPSACITNIELLKKVNDLEIPVIISNGMSTQYELDNAISNINNLIGILHCNSSYPSQYNELDLNVITEYKKKYSIPIGYSGHEIGYLPTIVAYSLGAEIIERHITLDNNLEGTDQKASLNIKELKNLIDILQKIKIIKGKKELIIYDSEKIIKNKLRK